VTEIPHLAWPLRLGANGAFTLVEQDTHEDVKQCVRVLFNTPLGDRHLAPRTGLADPTFSSGLDPVLTEQVLTNDDNEPRARVTIRTALALATGNAGSSTVYPGDELFPSDELYPSGPVPPGLSTPGGHQRVRVFVGLADDPADEPEPR